MESLSSQLTNTDFHFQRNINWHSFAFHLMLPILLWSRLFDEKLGRCCFFFLSICLCAFHPFYRMHCLLFLDLMIRTKQNDGRTEYFKLSHVSQSHRHHANGDWSREKNCGQWIPNNDIEFAYRLVRWIFQSHALLSPALWVHHYFNPLRSNHNCNNSKCYAR